MDTSFKKAMVIAGFFASLLIMLFFTVIDIHAAEGIECKRTYDLYDDYGDGEITMVKGELVSYSGYGRHRDGELIEKADQMDLKVTESGTVLELKTGGLLDYEDWQADVEFMFKKKGGSEALIRGVRHFSGTTQKDETVSDGYELAEKIRKYGEITLKEDISIPSDVSTVSIDGKTGKWKAVSSSFKKTIIRGNGHTISGKSDIFDISNEAAIDKTDIISGASGILIEREGACEFSDGSIICENGCCIKNKSDTLLDLENVILTGKDGIENNSDGFKAVAVRVIQVSGNRDMHPRVDLSAVPVGICQAALKDVSIDASDGYGIKNAGEMSFSGHIDISGNTAIINMGAMDFTASALDIDGNSVGIDNGSWLGIVMEVLGEKDSSYTKSDRYELALGLVDDLSVYAPATFKVSIRGSGSAVVTGGSEGIVNGGTIIIDNSNSKVYGKERCIRNAGSLCLKAGIVGGGSCGIYNTGTFRHAGGMVKGSSDIGVYQAGSYFMSGSASVDMGNVIHLAKGRVITVTGELSSARAGSISLSPEDIVPGRKVIITQKDNSPDMELADRLAGRSANGVMPENGRFIPAFEYVNGHKAALRSGKGDEENGPEGTVIISALYSAVYDGSIPEAPEGVTFKSPRETLYFWRERQVFHTGSDVSQDSRVRVRYDGKDITPSFILKGWKDDKGTYHSRDIECVYDDDHEFTADWDMALSVIFRGNKDTTETGISQCGSRDYVKEPMVIGSSLPGNTKDGSEYFIRSERAAFEGRAYMQNYSFAGWSTEGEVDGAKSTGSVGDNGAHSYTPGQKLTDMSMLFDALSENMAAFISAGDGGYRVRVSLYALWDAFPVIRTGESYIYDRELSDSDAVKNKLLSVGSVTSYDREDGVLSRESTEVFTNPVKRTFDVKSLCALGNCGYAPVYYGACDSFGNYSIFPSKVHVITSDDEDMADEMTIKENSRKTNPSGTSPASVDGVPVYVRYIGSDDLSTLSKASKWKEGENSKLLEAAFGNSVSESYTYDKEEIRKIQKLGMEEDPGKDSAVKVVLGTVSSTSVHETVKIKPYIREGISSLEVNWELCRDAQRAHITYEGDIRGELNVPAADCRAIITGLSGGISYTVKLELVLKDKVIGEGEAVARTETIAAPQLRLKATEEKGGGRILVYYTIPREISEFKIERKDNSKGRAEWKTIAEFDVKDALVCGTDPSSQLVEAVYGDPVPAGVYSYRIKAFGYTLGLSDERILCDSGYSKTMEAGYVNTPVISDTVAGIASFRIEWKKVSGADGYIITWKEKGGGTCTRRISKDEDSFVAAENIKEGTVCDVSLAAIINGEKSYRSPDFAKTKIKTLSLLPPRVWLSENDTLVTIGFDRCENAAFYTISRRKLPVYSHGTESFDTTSLCMSFRKDNGVYEYRVSSTGKRLDGSFIKKYSKL